MYYAAEFVEAGGLMFYGVDFADLYGRAASYVTRSSKALSQPTFRWNSRPSLNW
jgi:hypothetical protein